MADKTILELPLLQSIDIDNSDVLHLIDISDNLDKQITTGYLAEFTLKRSAFNLATISTAPLWEQYKSDNALDSKRVFIETISNKHRFGISNDAKTSSNYFLEVLRVANSLHTTTLRGTNVVLDGATSVTGSLGVTGTTTLYNTLTVNGGIITTNPINITGINASIFHPAIPEGALNHCVEIRNDNYSQGQSTGTCSLGLGFSNQMGSKVEVYKRATNQTGMKLYVEYGASNPSLVADFSRDGISLKVDTTIIGKITATGIDTGQGAVECYAMNQSLLDTDNPTFASINTGQGAVECYAMNQSLLDTDNPTFASINTGQGAVECYAMNQPVLSTSDVSFNKVSATNGFTTVQGINAGGGGGTASIFHPAQIAGVYCVEFRNDNYNQGTATGQVQLALGYSNHIGTVLETYKLSVNDSSFRIKTEYGFGNYTTIATFGNASVALARNLTVAGTITATNPINIAGATTSIFHPSASTGNVVEIRNDSYNQGSSSGTCSLGLGFANQLGCKLVANKSATNQSHMQIYAEYGASSSSLVANFAHNALSVYGYVWARDGIYIGSGGSKINNVAWVA